jgi:hypothetical protein
MEDRAVGKSLAMQDCGLGLYLWLGSCYSSPHLIDFPVDIAQSSLEVEKWKCEIFISVAVPYRTC